MHDEPLTGPAPSYPAARLRAALETAVRAGDAATRARAAAKAARWTAVLDGMASGRLTVGSRTPVAGAPAWATPEVVTGGFTTGRLLAEQPLDEAETARLSDLSPGPGSTERERLNLWYLGDAGQAELLTALAEERYRIELPEHAALAVVALLVDRGHEEAALDLLAELEPFLDRLRMTPVLTTDRVPLGASVLLEPVGAIAATLRAEVPPAQVVAMRESLGLWGPLYDDLVALWSETVEDGRPGRRVPEGWAARRSAWLTRYAEVAATSTASTRHQHPKSNFARLRRARERTDGDGPDLSAREAGWVRRALAGTTARHGAPGSDQRLALRAAQAEVVARPTHAALARVVAARLDAYPSERGLADVDAVVGDTVRGESPEVGEGVPVPASVVRVVRRATEGPVEDLVAHGVIGSGEVLARVLPQVTAQHVSASIGDAVVAGLHARTYTAFRRRRGLLLLDLAHQVRLEELPWVSALARFRSPRRTADGSAAALRASALLALDAFPQTILPNPLVRELDALAAAAGLRLPLVEEVAADIFMGRFTPKWRAAAVVAGETLHGTPYARYYDLPAPEVWAATEQVVRGRLFRRRRTVPAVDFAELCAERAVEAGRTGPGWSVAGNGTVLEQSQILTTHNLAVLTAGLGLEPELRRRAPELAARVFAGVLRAHSTLPREHHAALLAVKNIAYAWRQGIYLLGFCDETARAEVLHLLTRSTGPASRLRPAVDGLAHVLAGGRFDAAGRAVGGPGRRLLGWTVGPHPLLTPR
jgi:hypothetical protein